MLKISALRRLKKYCHKLEDKNVIQKLSRRRKENAGNKKKSLRNKEDT